MRFRGRELALGGAVLVGSMLVLDSACSSLLDANFDHDAGAGSNATDSGGSEGLTVQSDGASTVSTTTGGDASTLPIKPPADAGDDDDGDDDDPMPIVDGGSSDAGTKTKTYAAAQAALDKLRYPGPLTAQGATGACTDHRFVWKDSDGTLHSWLPDDSTTIDYTFKQPTSPTFFPGDVYIAVNTPSYSNLTVYDTTKAGSLVSTQPYTYAAAGLSSGVLRFDLVAGSQIQMRNWDALMGTTVDAGTPVPQQPPTSVGLNEAVIPASVNIPFPLYILNISGKTISSVTFDAATSLINTLSTPSGLVVSYTRSSGPEVRLYKNNDNTSRDEVGDDLANIPKLFSDSSSAMEHTFEAHLALDGNHLIYASPFGIFGYELTTGALTALQLGENQTVFVPNIMCVIAAKRLLVYRVPADTNGQIWVVPLTGLLN